MNEFVYRPQQKREQELIDDFVLRQKELQKLLDSISSDKKGAAPQHILLQGVRGMGKTTMMYRTFYQVQRDMADQGIVPVIFSEEQYSIRTLYKLWEQIARYLEDHRGRYTGLWQHMQDFQGDDETYEEHCFELLKAALTQNDHRLVLFIDNFGVMVDKFKKQEQQRFREILISFSGIKIIGGSVVILDSFYAHDKPFFDFFKVMRLEKLGTKEIQTLLLRLDEKHSANQMPEIIEKQPGRIESLRILTNGVPRTIVLLFDIFLDNVNGHSIEDLRRLMDMVTPLYQHRMDNLPPQQQEIIDKLALNWDGMTTGELAERTRMESKAVSSQLKYLEKSGVVHATKSTGKNKFYQLEERFFNIWYLMHHSPRGYRYKVIWLARFLEMWCDGKSLTENVRGFQQKLRSGKVHPEYTLTMLHAYAQTEGVTSTLRDELVEVARESMINQSQDLFKSIPAKWNDLWNRLEMMIDEQSYKQALSLIAKSSLPTSLAAYLNGYVADSASDYEKASSYYEQAFNSGAMGAMNNLAYLYEDKFRDYERARVYYKKGADSGDRNAMNNLAVLYQKQFEDYEKAKSYYNMAIGSGDVGAINNLAILYENHFEDFELAERLYTQAIESGSKMAKSNLIDFYVTRNWASKKNEAKRIYQMLKNEDSDGGILSCLSYLLWIEETEALDDQFVNMLARLERAFDKWSGQMGHILKFAIAKGLNHLVLKLFNLEQYPLKDRFKVIYYALLDLMQDEYPNELKRMPRELEEPVKEMMAEIKALGEKYNK